jgi:hypothetical protein
MGSMEDTGRRPDRDSGDSNHWRTRLDNNRSNNAAGGRLAEIRDQPSRQSARPEWCFAALEPEESFYQRVLAGDATEAADQAERQLKSQALSTYYDAIPMKALLLAQADAAHGKLSREKQLEIRDTIDEIVDDLDHYPDQGPAGEKEEPPAENKVPIVSKGQLPDDWQVPYPVLCVASRSALDEAACAMLAQILGKHGIAAWVQPFADVASAKGFKVDTTDSRVVCLSYFGATSKPVHVRYLIRRLKRVMPHAKFLAGFWMLGEDDTKVEDWREAVGADFVAASLAEATALVVAEALSAQSQTRKDDGHCSMAPVKFGQRQPPTKRPPITATE